MKVANGWSAGHGLLRTDWPRYVEIVAAAFLLSANGQAQVLSGRHPGMRAGVEYSFAQSRVGQALYGAKCAMCHGYELQGAAGPALSGLNFKKTWMNGSKTVGNLVDLISSTMPADRPGSLRSAQVLDIIGYLFQKNGLLAGVHALQKDSLGRPIPRASGVSSVPVAQRTSLHLPQGPASAGEASGTLPSGRMIAQESPGNWLTYNRDYAGDRFSPLAQINTDNVVRLRPICIRQFGEIGSFETSPLIYDGTIYLTTPHDTFAVNGANCKIIWSQTYVPVGPEHIPGNRGVSLYRGEVYRGTTDGYLLALDARTGKVLWKAHVANAYRGGFISGAPLAFDGKVFIGEAGADNGIRGRFFAFNAKTGRPVWTFDIVPRRREAGNDGSWGSGVPRGGSSWSSVTLDRKKHLLLVPTGNPGPDFDGRGRPGANLYTDSVVALNTDSGRLVWYVQQVPHDVHDWDTAAAPVIYDRKDREYMAVASKDGFLYVYDRASQQLLFRSEMTNHRNVNVPFSPIHPVTYCPGGLGQWNGPAYSAPLDLLFVGSADRCDTILALKKPAPFVPGQFDFGARLMTKPGGASEGWIRAFNAETGREVWAYQAQTPIVAGMTPTAGGLLFTGDLNGHFLVMNARTGKVLYQFMTGGGIAGGISTYKSHGKQYVAVPTGSSSQATWGSTGSATLMIFALP